MKSSLEGEPWILKGPTSCITSGSRSCCGPLSLLAQCKPASAAVSTSSSMQVSLGHSNPACLQLHGIHGLRYA